MNEREKLKQMYWQQGLTICQIAQELDWSYSKTYKRFRIKYQIDTHKSFWQQLEISDTDLRICLNNKYSNMKARISGRHDPYETCRGKLLLSEQDFIELCNEQKQHILNLWQQYLNSGKQLKFAMSIDRINNDLDYTKENLQFVTHGFNSWKDHLNPIAIQKENDIIRYFGSPEEASRFYNCRPDDIREVIRNEKYNRQNITITKISISELLNHRNCPTLHEYYWNYIA